MVDTHEKIIDKAFEKFLNTVVDEEIKEKKENATQKIILEAEDETKSLTSTLTMLKERVKTEGRQEVKKIIQKQAQEIESKIQTIEKGIRGKINKEQRSIEQKKEGIRHVYKNMMNDAKTDAKKGVSLDKVSKSLEPLLGMKDVGKVTKEQIKDFVNGLDREIKKISPVMPKNEHEFSTKNQDIIEFYANRFTDVYEKEIGKPKYAKIVNLHMQQLAEHLLPLYDTKDKPHKDVGIPLCVDSLFNMYYDPRLGISKEKSLDGFLNSIKSNLPEEYSFALDRIAPQFSNNVTRFAPVYNAIYDVITDKKTPVIGNIGEEVARDPEVFNAIYELSKEFGKQEIDKEGYYNAIRNLFKKIDGHVHDIDAEAKYTYMTKVLDKVGVLDETLTKYNDEFRLTEPSLIEPVKQRVLSDIDIHLDESVGELFDTFIKGGANSYILSGQSNAEESLGNLKGVMEKWWSNNKAVSYANLMNTQVSVNVVDEAEKFAKDFIKKVYGELRLKDATVQKAVEDKVIETASELAREKLRENIAQAIKEKIEVQVPGEIGSDEKIQNIRNSKLPDLMIEFQRNYLKLENEPKERLNYVGKWLDALQDIGIDLKDQPFVITVLQNTFHPFQQDEMKDKFKEIGSRAIKHITCANISKGMGDLQIDDDGIKEKIAKLSGSPKDFFMKSSGDLALMMLEAKELENSIGASAILDENKGKLKESLSKYSEKLNILRNEKINELDKNKVNIFTQPNSNFNEMLNNEKACSEFLTKLSNSKVQPELEGKFSKNQIDGVVNTLLDTAPFKVIEKVVDTANKVHDQKEIGILEKIKNFFVEILQSIGIMKSHNQLITEACKEVSGLAKDQEKEIKVDESKVNKNPKKEVLGHFTRKVVMQEERSIGRT